VANGLDPIADDEILYRRVPANWFDATSHRPLDQAFAPNKDRDITGLSLSRAKYKTVQEAALGQPGKTYYVAVLRASDVKQIGMAIEPRPTPNDPGHSEFPDLRADNRKDGVTLERQQRLVELCLGIEGPFITPPAAQP
jgi:hypothetical protein